MKTICFSIIFLFFSVNLVAQQVKVITFNHTVRWLDESKFPNYFIDNTTKDSVYADIRKNLETALGANDIVMPEKVKYKIIAGFGKAKTEPVSEIVPAGKVVEIYSFLTRATSGFAVFWGVKVLVKENGKSILENEAKCEIINENATAYFSSVRWLSAKEFRSIFLQLFSAAIGTGEPVGEKITVGRIEEKEKELVKWFPDSERCILQINGAMVSAGNFSGRLVSGIDTIFEMSYKSKTKIKNISSPAKGIFAEIFSDLSGIGVSYDIKQKEVITGIMSFPDYKEVKIQLEIIESITQSTNSNEISKQVIVPMIGQLIIDEDSVSEFVYEQTTETLTTSESKEKFSLAGGYYNENTFGTAVHHKLKGKLFGKDFIAEYNELFGFLDIKIDDEIVASVVMQNCNPDNLMEYNNTKLTKNKKTMVGGSSNIGKPKINDTTKQEWYPYYIKKGASTEEIMQSFELLICLFFGMGNM